MSINVYRDSDGNLDLVDESESTVKVSAACGQQWQSWLYVQVVKIIIMDIIHVLITEFLILTFCHLLLVKSEIKQNTNLLIYTVM